MANLHHAIVGLGPRRINDEDSDLTTEKRKP